MTQDDLHPGILEIVEVKANTVTPPTLGSLIDRLRPFFPFIQADLKRHGIDVEIVDLDDGVKRRRRLPR